MAVTGKQYANFTQHLGTKVIDFPNDTAKFRLLSSSYTPDQAAHTHGSDLTNELSTANGYTALGVAAASKTCAFVAANSHPTAAATSTAYALGDIVRPAAGNGHLYKCVVAGTSGGSAPTWPTTRGTSVVDGGATWAECGIGYVMFDAADPSWTVTGAGFTYRYLALVDTAPGTEATNPLVAFFDMGADIVAVAGTHTIVLPAMGVAYFMVN
jgi:hypothetical protein